MRGHFLNNRADKQIRCLFFSFQRDKKISAHICSICSYLLISARICSGIFRAASLGWANLLYLLYLPQKGVLKKSPRAKKCDQRGKTIYSAF